MTEDSPQAKAQGDSSPSHEQRKRPARKSEIRPFETEKMNSHDCWNDCKPVANY
jgi:hypothetical protein